MKADATNLADARAEVAKQARAAAADLHEAGASVAADATDVAGSARAALEEMRRIVADFATSTGEKASDVVDTVGGIGVDATERVGALAGELRGIGRVGFENVADAVAKRPMTALAVAAGVGLLLGLVTRPGPRA